MHVYTLPYIGFYLLSSSGEHSKYTLKSVKFVILVHFFSVIGALASTPIERHRAHLPTAHLNLALF